MIVTKENGTIYTNGLNLEVINWHKENNFIIAEVNRPLTKDEDNNYVDDITEDEINLGTKAIRGVLYRIEVDPLFFKVQRGEIDNQIWLDKVAEIKAITQEVLNINVSE
jgi:hypothetical protein